MTRAKAGAFGFIALLTLAIGMAAQPAQAVSIGLLAQGDAYADTIASSGPTFSEEYDFQLASSTYGLTILATALGQTSATMGVDNLTIGLYDSSNILIASASGAPSAFFDSFAQSGLALAAGSYLFTIDGAVTAGKQAFVSISLAVNAAQTPIPAAGLLLLTGVGALGALAARRRAKANAA